MMPRLVSLCLLLVFAMPAAAQRNRAEAPPASPLAMLGTLPAEILGFTRSSVVDFEGQPDRAGLGAAAEYRIPGVSGVATVYVYDRGQQGIATGAETPAVQEEMQRALQEIDALAAPRRYSVTERDPLAPLTDARGRPALSCQHLLLHYASGQLADSYLCAGALRQRFVKLRFTLAPAAPGRNEGTLRGFGSAVVDALTATPG